MLIVTLIHQLHGIGIIIFRYCCLDKEAESENLSTKVLEQGLQDRAWIQSHDLTPFSSQYENICNDETQTESVYIRFSS